MISHTNIFAPPISGKLSNPYDPYEEIFYLRVDRLTLQWEIDRLKIELDLYKVMDHNKKIVEK